MLVNYLFLSLCVSIDSLGIGITYGLKNTKISHIAKLLLFIISLCFTTLSIYIGDLLCSLLPEFITKIIGSLILIFMGFWIIYQSFGQKNFSVSYPTFENTEKIYTLFIKCLGITIQIIRNPISSDLDNSKKIDAKEALFLGIALSLDSLCVGIGSSFIGFNSLMFPIFVATFQLFFLSLGSFIGKKISSTSKLPKQIWNLISGVLLILIGISKFIF